MSSKPLYEPEFIPAEQWQQIEDRERGIAQVAKVTVQRERVAQSVVNVFERLGGEARMMEWADQNYGEFMKLYAKLLPSQTKELQPEDNTLKIQHRLPRTKLDD